jgi:hypothetical protein
MVAAVERHEFITGPALRGLSARTCGGCSIGYARFRAGNSFTDARQALKYSTDRNGNERRFIGRRGVLGQLHAWKLDLWAEHLRSCGRAALDVSDRSWHVEHGHHALQLRPGERFDLGADVGDRLDVRIDGELYIASCDVDRIVLRVPWQETRHELPATRVCVFNPRLRELPDEPFTLF